MFAKACKIAREFTRPVVLSSRNTNGTCEAGIGAFVVINDDGWILTAWHIVDRIRVLSAQSKARKDYEAAISAIEADPALDRKAKSRAKRHLPSPEAHSSTNYSAWWGWDGAALAEWHALPATDLALGRLEPFKKEWIKAYPEFKDPAKELAQGTSLCKLGFPLHSITPTFDGQKNSFILPKGAVPPPFFPVDGIFCRVVELQGVPNPPTYPLRYIETTSPGLRGQSGGPIFDVQGTLWAIQSRTQHYPLGFGNDLKPGQLTSKQIEYVQNQYLNTGWGVHPATILGLLKEKSVRFTLAGY